MPSPLNTEMKDGWTVIANDDGSSVVTKDYETNYLVTVDGCSCGKKNCKHYKLVYPTPPIPPAHRNHAVDIRKGHPAGEKESEPFKLPENTMLAGLFVVCVALSGILRGVGYVLSTIGRSLAPMEGDDD